MLLIDNALSPLLARALAQAGHDVVHVGDLGEELTQGAVVTFADGRYECAVCQ
jgi:predicted nuclease of predicted toxin-antitoxin system